MLGLRHKTLPNHENYYKKDFKFEAMIEITVLTDNAFFILITFSNISFFT